MNVVDRQNSGNAIYLPSELKVRSMAMEISIASSIHPILNQVHERIEGNKWKLYDGDIWMAV